MQNISSIKNNENDISFENNENMELNDDENFNVIMSGSILNTNNKKVTNKNSNNITKTNSKIKITQINLVNIGTQKKSEKVSKLSNLIKTPIPLNKNTNINKKNLKTKENNNVKNFRSSSIKSKEQFSFPIKYESKKKAIVRTVKTPDIQSKNLIRPKSKNKVDDTYILLNKK